MYEATSHHFQTKRKVVLQRISRWWYILFAFWLWELHKWRCWCWGWRYEFRRLVKRNKFSILSQCRHFFLCILEVQSNHSILSKLLETVLPKRKFLIPAVTLFQKVRDISKGYTWNCFVQEMPRLNGFLSLRLGLSLHLMKFMTLMLILAMSWIRYLCLQYARNIRNIIIYIRKASCWDFMFIVP